MASDITPIYIKAFDQTKQAFASVNKSLSGLRQSLLSVQGAFGGLLTGYTVTQVAQLADAYNSVNARLKLVTDSSKSYNTAQKELFALSQRTRAGYAETVDLFSTLTRSTKSLGVSQKDMIGLTEGINQALAVSGASGASAQAALIQLGQGFAAGALRGQEFMSVAEQAPYILDVLSEGLGVTRGELKKMADEGLLTTATFIRGFSAGADELADKFNSLPVTVAGSMQRIRNSTMVLVGAMDSATGASSSFAKSVESLAKFMERLAPSIEKNKEGINLFLKLAGTAIGILAAASAIKILTGAVIALGLAVTRNKALTALLAIGTVGQAIYESTRKKLPDLSDVPDESEAERRRLGLSTDTGGTQKIVTTTLAKSVKTIGTYTDQINEAIASAIKSSDVVRAKELADQIKALDELYFTAGLDAEIYDSAMRKLTGSTESFGKEVNKVKDAVDAAISDNALTRGNDMLLKIAELDKRFFDGAITIEQYDAAMAQMTGSTKSFSEEIEKVKSPLEKFAESMPTLEDAMQSAVVNGIKSMEDSLVGLVNGTMSVKDAFRSMATSVINDLIRMSIQQQITAPLARMFGLQAAAPSIPLYPKAIGGSVQAGKPYMVGERGAEMFVPNQSGSIIPNNQMGGGGGVTIVQNINVTTGVQQTVRAEIMTLMPQIAGAAKAAVADANLRGGSYRAALR